ncbi:uncharacterized protein LOC126381255 [Pectinophora gossypiella]|uniref:uncharacterized protein LOC126381255 n=1 Tax=Pectinophora gossypiella TaxID=13191 RepID=UPI00214F23CC|nr:uncharacterized protein LOC126381255 [Pectinophora gossypiella]
MVVCGRCGADVRDYIQCCACNKYFDFPCSGITEKGWRKLGLERQAVWKCPDCKIVTPKPTAVTTTDTDGAHLVTVTSSPSVPSVPATARTDRTVVSTGETRDHSSPHAAVTLDQVMRELMSIKRTLIPLPEVITGIQEIRNVIGKINTSLSALSDRVEVLETKVKAAEGAHDAVLRLEARVIQLESDLNEKNQWARLNNVEIKGVPMKDRENLFDVVAKIGSKIAFPIVKQNINFVARVPSMNDKAKPIIVSFINRYAKEDFVAAARSFKNLYPIEIGLEGRNRIYINDHLTVQNKLLLNEAKKLKQLRDYQYVWVKNSKIFMRKDDHSKIIAIRNPQDLEKLR